MKKVIFLILFAAFFLIITVSAAEIVFKTENTDYYFKTGEEAAVPVFIENSYGHDVSGLISYTTKETLETQGVSYTTSKSHSESFLVPEGNSRFSIGGGSSDSPATVQVSLSFEYKESTGRIVNLKPFYIHFEDSGKSTGASSTGDPLESKDSDNIRSGSSSQSTQQIIQNMLAQDQMPLQNHMTSQQALMNSQMSQNSLALKKQMEEKSARNEEERNALRGIIENDTLFRSVNESLVSQGFFSPDIRLNPDSKISGTFSKYYEPDSRSGNITAEGLVDNGSVKYIRQTTDLSTKLPEGLLLNESYQKIEGIVSEQNFSPLNTVINTTPDWISVERKYQNDDGDNASLIAVVKKDGNLSILEFDMSGDDEDNSSALLTAISIIAILSGAAVIYLLYTGFFRKNDQGPQAESENISKKLIDPKKEIQKILEYAVLSFENEEYARAYAAAGQAVRLYFTYKYGDMTEMTNEETVGIIPDSDRNRDFVIEILTKCSDVEFAKGTAERESFYSIIQGIKEIVFK